MTNDLSFLFTPIYLYSQDKKISSAVNQKVITVAQQHPPEYPHFAGVTWSNVTSVVTYCWIQQDDRGIVRGVASVEIRMILITETTKNSIPVLITKYF